MSGLVGWGVPNPDDHTPVYKELEANNRTFQEQFADEATPASAPPRRKVAVLTCMDARLRPEAFLGLRGGDAHIIRNAGGRASEDAIRSLVISQQLLGTREIIVIHHTDCGMKTFTNEAFRARLKNDMDVETDMDFMPYVDLGQSIRDDLEILRASALILPGTPITGAIYDVHTGRLTQFEED